MANIDEIRSAIGAWVKGNSTDPEHVIEGLDELGEFISSLANEIESEIGEDEPGEYEDDDEDEDED